MSLLCEMDDAPQATELPEASRTSVRLQPVSPLQSPGWEAQLALHPEAGFFHTAAWARVLYHTYGHRPQYLMACELAGSGAPAAIASGMGLSFTGLLPVMEVSSPLTGRRGVALPFTDLVSPLTSDTVSSEQMLNQAIELGRQRRWRYFECRGMADAPSGAVPFLTFWGHTLDLSPSESQIHGGLHDSVRRAVRKAQNHGLQFRIDRSREGMQTFYTLHCRTRQKHGLPPQPFAFFQNIHEHVLGKDLGFITIVSLEQVPLAAAVFLHFGKQAIYKFGASDSASLAMRPNDLLMWEVIRWLRANGFSSLHFGRTDRHQDGLRRFKLGFGACEQTIEYFRFDYRQNIFVSGSSRVEGWHNYVFRNLPLPLNRLLGRLLYRHLS